MAIYLDEENNQTICECDICGVRDATTWANGVVCENWGTGHLWLDVSLTEQVQKPLCFCPSCSGLVMHPDSVMSLDFTIPETEPIPEPDPVPDPT